MAQGSLRDLLVDEPTVPSSNPIRPGARLSDLLADTPDGKAPSATPMDMAGAALESGARSGLATGGMAAGARVGAMIPTIPGKIAGVIGGGVLGYLMGNSGADYIEDISGQQLRTPEEMPEFLRPAAVGGEVFGGAMTGAGLITGAAKAGMRATGTGVVGKFINNMLENAATRPGVFLTAEGSAAASAAMAEGVSEYYLPGNAAARIGAGVGGGFVNPTAHALRFGTRAVDTARSLFSKEVAQEGSKSRIRTALSDLLHTFGEDPKELARQLEGMDFKDVPTTVAQSLDSPAIRALETQFRGTNAKFDVQAKIAGDNAITTFRRLIEGTASGGTPEDLQAAAKLRQDYTRGLLQGLLGKAEAKAADMVRQMQVVDDVTVMAANTKISELVNESTQLGRNVERSMWARAPQNINMKANNVLSTFEEVLKERFMGYPKFPVDVEKFLSMSEGELRRNLQDMPGAADDLVEFIGNIKNVMRDNMFKEGSIFKVAKSGDLIKLRNRAIETSNRLMSGGNPRVDEARAISRIAEAALDDLSVLPGPEFSPIREAQEYSHLFNETFNKSFVGKLTERAANGAPRISPEIMGFEMINNGPQKGHVYFQELRKAIGHGLEIPSTIKTAGGAEVPSPTQVEAQISELMKAQADVILYAASRTIDPIDGKVRPVALAEFKRKNGLLLKQFPELQSILNNAGNAQAAFENVLKHKDTVKESLKAIGQIVSSEDPVMAIAPILRNSNYRAGIRQLAQTAKRAGGKAPDGLLAAAIETATLEGTNAKTGQMSVAAFKNAFDGRNSVLNELSRNGIIDKNQADHMRRLMQRMTQIEKTRETQPKLDSINIEGVGDILRDVVDRLTGVHIASRMSDIVGMSGPGRLVIAGIGSRAAQKILKGVPDAKTKDMMVALMKDPQQMANLLREVKTPAEKIRQFALLHAYLMQTGLSAGIDAQEQPAPAVPMTPAAPRPL